MGIWNFFRFPKIENHTDLNSEHPNGEPIRIGNFYLFGVQMVANGMVQTFCLGTIVKGSLTKCHSVNKVFTKLMQVFALPM